MSVLIKRNKLSTQYIRGKGIEIGALHGPLNVTPDAHVQYVDRMTVDDLRSHYPELKDLDLIEPNVIDDGEKLDAFALESLDFIIANHMLEHCENPIGTLQNHLKKIKSGGILYYAIPDKNYTFDSGREITTFEHLEYDYILGASGSREQHFRDWVTHVNQKKGEDASNFVKHLMSINYSIHFHVWDFRAFCMFLRGVVRYVDISFVIEELIENEDEIICVMRRVSQAEKEKADVSNEVLLDGIMENGRLSLGERIRRYLREK